MRDHGKRYKNARQQVDRKKTYTVEDAVGLALDMPKAKFDETVEVAFRLGVDPKKADQMVRGTITLPHGTGKSARVAVFAVGDYTNRPGLVAGGLLICAAASFLLFLLLGGIGL